MSGFEMVGLVLAVVPICTAAISHYRSSLNVVNRARRWHVKLPEYARRLRMQRDQLELTLQLLLIPLLGREPVLRMIKDFASPQWSDETVWQTFQERYGSVENTFKESITSICDLMKKLVARLGLASPDIATYDELRAVVDRNPPQPDGTYHFRQRLTFAFSRKEIEDLFNQLNVAQSNLDSLKRKQDELRMMAATKESATGASLRLLRKRAKSLHRVLIKVSRCSQHQAHDPHEANLHLHQSGFTDGSDEGSGQTDDKSIFHIASLQPWGWQRFEVHVVETPSKAKQRLKPIQQFKTQILDELCGASLQQQAQQCSSIGLTLDLQKGESLSGIFHAASTDPGKWTISGATMDFEGLTALLQTPRQRIRASTYIPQPSRTVIASNIASAVMQLYTTEWLHSLSKQDILFLCDKSAQNTEIIDWEQPYLRHRCGTQNVVARSNTAIPLESRRSHHQAVALGLGILLMELWFGQTIESQRPGKAPELSPANALNDWYDVMGEELPEAYYQAVGLCKGLDSQDEAFVTKTLGGIAESLTTVSKVLRGHYQRG